MGAGQANGQELDLADLRSIKALADDLSASLPRLDLLVCNAGMMALRPMACAKDGFEMLAGHAAMPPELLLLTAGLPCIPTDCVA